MCVSAVFVFQMDWAVTAGGGFQEDYVSLRLMLPVPVGTLWSSLQKAGTELLGPGLEKKMCVSVSVLVSTCLQPVKLFAFEDFSTCQRA